MTDKAVSALPQAESLDAGTAVAGVQDGVTVKLPALLLSQLLPFAVAALPSAAAYPRCSVWVTDAAGGAVAARSDGTNWRREDDGEIVA